MFIRQKLIYNNPYAYLVKTKWDKKSKKVRQKVSKYLGRIYGLDRVRNRSFIEYFNVEIDNYVSETPFKKIVKDLIQLEFYRHGFEIKEKNLMENGVHTVDIEKIDKVFAMNEGFMNQNTVNQILRYDNLLGETNINIPFKFASLFVNAGIDIEKELFIALYQKSFSDNI